MIGLTSPNGNHASNGSDGDNGHRTKRVESAKP